MKTTATNKRLRELLTAMRDGTLIPNPAFQRRLVWATRHKSAFISTVLDGYPFPEIYIAAGDVDLETGAGKLMLVDGQQRMTTLYEYFSGTARIPGIPKYKLLEQDQKKDFLEYEVVVRDLGSLPIEDIKAVFQRINSTAYSLNAMEVHNSRYDGDLKQLADDLSKSQIFDDYRVFSANEIRRMTDVRYTLTIIITMMSTYFNRDDELEIYLKKYNEELKDKERISTEFINTLNFIKDCEFQPDSRAWKRTDLFTLMIETHRKLFIEKKKLDPKLVRQNVEAFFEKVRTLEDDDAKAYNLAALQASNDRSSRIARGKRLSVVLDRCIS